MQPTSPSTSIYSIAQCESEASEFEKQGYTWEELKRVEARRRAILKRAELPFRQVLSFWDGTSLRTLSMDWLLWVTAVLYVLVRLQVRFTDAMLGYAERIGDTNIDVIGGFLSFFLVLFVNQSNSRFHEMYMSSMTCCGKIEEVASLVNASFPTLWACRLVRYMNAAHAAGYVGLSHTYAKESFFDPLNSTHNLLAPCEMKRIIATDMNHGVEAFNEIMEWCYMDIYNANKKGFVDNREAGVLKEKMSGFKNAMAKLYDFNDQPIAFFYIHFLCLLSALYLPLFAVNNAYNAGTGDDISFTADVLYGLLVLLQAAFVIGLRVLGQKMIDPYGDDLEDLSVIHYVHGAWLTSNRILATEYPGEPDEILERHLHNTKESLGYPWSSTPPPFEHKLV